MDPDIQALQKRLNMLEKANRKMRYLGFALILGTVVLFSAQCRNSRILEAERFILKDAKGETRGGMLLTADGPALEFSDSNRTTRLILSVFRNTPNVVVKDANGTGVVVLADVPTGPGLMLYDRSGNPRAQLDVGNSGPRLYLEDAKGFSTTVGSYFTGDPVTDNKLNAASVVLAAKGLGVFWSAPPR